MPLFEYECRACGKAFEHFSSGDSRPACPDCDGRALRKLLSVFAVFSSDGGGVRTKVTAGEGSCGSCGDPRGPGACSVN
jgi:putative FmdB family regulatory protein